MIKIENYEDKLNKCIDVLGQEIRPGDICLTSASSGLEILICSHMAQTTLVFKPIVKNKEIDFSNINNKKVHFYKRQVLYRDINWKVLKLNNINLKTIERNGK